MINLIIRFCGEWIHLENLKLIGIFMGVAIITSTAISPIDFTRQGLWRTLVLGTFACIWIHGQNNTMSYQGLQSCLVFLQSLTMHRWITRSASQGASYGWDPGIHANSVTSEEDTYMIISVPAKRTHTHAKVEAALMEDGSITHITIRHNNSDPVSCIRSTTFNEMGSRPTISRHTHTNISTDNAANDKIIHRTNHQYNVMETIIDTGTYINNLSGHFHPGEHMRRITRTRALQSSPSTNARHLPDKDLVEVSDWSR